MQDLMTGKGAAQDHPIDKQNAARYTGPEVRPGLACIQGSTWIRIQGRSAEFVSRQHTQMSKKHNRWLCYQREADLNLAEGVRGQSSVRIDEAQQVYLFHKILKPSEGRLRAHLYS